MVQQGESITPNMCTVVKNILILERVLYLQEPKEIRIWILNFYLREYGFKMQPRKVFCKEKLFLKILNIHRKTPVSETLFNKVAGLKV